MSSTNGRGRERDRIRRQLRRAAERRHHGDERGVGGGNADHVVLERHHRIVRRRAEVAGIAHGDDADAVRLRFLDGELHGQRRYPVSEPLRAVVETGGHAVLLEDGVGVHHHEAVLPQLVIARQHIDAMRVDAAQVGAHHELGGDDRTLTRHLHRGKRVGDERGEPCVIDDDGRLGHRGSLLQDGRPVILIPEFLSL
jgi:hypothetical protein